MWSDSLTFLFEKNAALGDDDWDVAVNVALSFIVEQRNGDVGVSDALLERHSEDALGAWNCTNASANVVGLIKSVTRKAQDERSCTKKSTSSKRDGLGYKETDGCAHT